MYTTIVSSKVWDIDLKIAVSSQLTSQVNGWQYKPERSSVHQHAWFYLYTLFVFLQPTYHWWVFHTAPLWSERPHQTVNLTLQSRFRACSGAFTFLYTVRQQITITSTHLNLCHCQKPADCLHSPSPIEVVQHNFISHCYCVVKSCQSAKLETGGKQCTSQIKQ